MASKSIVDAFRGQEAVHFPVLGHHKPLWLLQASAAFKCGA